MLLANLMNHFLTTKLSLLNDQLFPGSVSFASFLFICKSIALAPHQRQQLAQLSIFHLLSFNTAILR